jgi:hypothetical protein
MDGLSNFIIGVASGLSATAIGFLLKLGYVPIHNVLTSNSIAGTWNSEYKEDQNTYQEEIEVRQSGSTIYATAILRKDDGTKETQKIKGTYKNQILTAEYWSTEKRGIERGTFTLKRATRERLEGFVTFFSGDPLKLRESPYTWKYSKNSK